jgi:uncharacterized membrane-anchored protein
VAVVATLVAMPFGSTGALLIWQLLGAAGGLFVMWQIRQIAVLTRPDLDRNQITLRTAAAAVFVMPVWLFVTVGVTHVDDMLALVLTVCAVRAVVSGRPLLAVCCSTPVGYRCPTGCTAG